MDSPAKGHKRSAKKIQDSTADPKKESKTQKSNDQRLLNEPNDDYMKIPKSEKIIIQRILRHSYKTERRKSLRKEVERILKRKGKYIDIVEDPVQNYIKIAPETLDIDTEFPVVDFDKLSFKPYSPPMASRPHPLAKKRMELLKEINNRKLLSPEKEEHMLRFYNDLDSEVKDNDFVSEKEENFFSRAVNLGAVSSGVPLSFPIYESEENLELERPRSIIKITTTTIVDYRMANKPPMFPKQDLKTFITENAQTELKKSKFNLNLFVYR